MKCSKSMIWQLQSSNIERIGYLTSLNYLIHGLNLFFFIIVEFFMYGYSVEKTISECSLEYFYSSKNMKSFEIVRFKLVLEKWKFICFNSLSFDIKKNRVTEFIKLGKESFVNINGEKENKLKENKSSLENFFEMRCWHIWYF